MPQSLFQDREGVLYRIVFFPEAGIDWSPVGPHANVAVISEANGPIQAAEIVRERLHEEYSNSDWLNPEAGYTQFVDENRNTLARFVDGEISTAAFNVPYGTVVIG